MGPNGMEAVCEALGVPLFSGDLEHVLALHSRQSEPEALLRGDQSDPLVEMTPVFTPEWP